MSLYSQKIIWDICYTLILAFAFIIYYYTSVYINVNHPDALKYDKHWKQTSITTSTL
jgi:hypothetical protein